MLVSSGSLGATYDYAKYHCFLDQAVHQYLRSRDPTCSMKTLYSTSYKKTHLIINVQSEDLGLLEKVRKQEKSLPQLATSQETRNEHQ